MKKHVKTMAGMALAAGLIWLLFRETDWAAVGKAISAAQWQWLLVSLLLVLATFVTRVQRWSYIVRTAKPVSFRHLFSATQIGFLGNFVLPARIGEVLRALVLSRLTGLAFTRCFAFVALDRVTDLFGLIAVIIIALAAFRPDSDIVLPPELLDVTIPANAIQQGAALTGFAIAAILIAFAVLYFKQEFLIRLIRRVISPVSANLSNRIEGLMRTFAEGLHVFRSYGDMARAIGFSLLTWFIGVLAYHSILVAFGLATHWYTSVLVMAFLAVAISVPSAPGFIGLFHFAIAGAVYISDPQSDLNVIKAAAIMSHLMNLLPVAAVGVYCLYAENLGLLALQRESAAVEDETTA